MLDYLLIPSRNFTEGSLQLGNLMLYHSSQLSISNTITIDHDSLRQVSIDLLITPQGSCGQQLLHYVKTNLVGVTTTATDKVVLKGNGI